LALQGGDDAPDLPGRGGAAATPGSAHRFLAAFRASRTLLCFLGGTVPRRRRTGPLNLSDRARSSRESSGGSERIASGGQSTRLGNMPRERSLPPPPALLAEAGAAILAASLAVRLVPFRSLAERLSRGANTGAAADGGPQYRLRGG